MKFRFTFFSEPESALSSPSRPWTKGPIVNLQSAALREREVGARYRRVVVAGAVRRNGDTSGASEREFDDQG